MLDSNRLSFASNSGALAAYRRVKLNSSGKLEYAGASDIALGTLQTDIDTAEPSKTFGAVMQHAFGIHYATYGSATALAVGDEIEAAASGKVTKRVTGARAGIALETAAADGDIIRVVYDPAYNLVNAPVLVDADGATLTGAYNGGYISNAGASGAATFVLPAAQPGMSFTFIVEAAQELRIDPSGTETVALPSTGVQGAAGKYLTADAVAEKVKLVCLSAGTWDVEHYSGTWTAEA